MQCNNVKSILHPDFQYIPSAKTDIRVTFERIKRELQSAQNNINNKPLVLNLDQFILAAEWLD